MPDLFVAVKQALKAAIQAAPAHPAYARILSAPPQLGRSVTTFMDAVPDDERPRLYEMILNHISWATPGILNEVRACSLREVMVGSHLKSPPALPTISPHSSASRLCSGLCVILPVFPC